MKKEELLAHQADYRGIICQANAAIEMRCFQRAVDLAVSAWVHVDAMMEYERKYADREFESVECVDIVLRYAPLLLDAERLDQLEELLKKKRRVEKNTTDNLKNRLDQARTTLHDTYRLLGLLESQPPQSIESLGKALGDGIRKWQALVSQLEEVDIIHRQTDSDRVLIRLVTSLNEPISAKCMSCGQVTLGAKSDFLVERICCFCNQTTYFVALWSK